MNIKRDLVKTELINPNKLVSCDRFDIFAKYIYAKYRKNSVPEDWAEKVYLAHIKVFNGFVENDNSNKIGSDSFINEFNALLDSISANGFDPKTSIIPVDSDGVIIDGAHRVAASLLSGADVQISKLKTHAPSYNYEYFLKNGLSKDFCDHIALEYCNYEKNVFVPLVWPAAKGKDDDIKNIFRKYGDIFYAKEMMLSDQGAVSFIRQIYYDEPWLGTYNDGFAGARKKKYGCFCGNGPVRVYIIKSNLNDMLKAKSEIRELFSIGNHSIHINDTREEALMIANLVLNKNSIHFLNYSRITAFTKFTMLVDNFTKAISTTPQVPVDCCLVGSSVMAAYGLRDIRDLDCVCLADYGIKNLDGEIELKTELPSTYGTELSELIHNPQNHFYCDRMKYAAIQLLYKHKKTRNSSIDSSDIELIDRVINAAKSDFFKRFRKYWDPRYYLVIIRTFILNLRRWGRSITTK